MKNPTQHHDIYPPYSLNIVRRKKIQLPYLQLCYSDCIYADLYTTCQMKFVTSDRRNRMGEGRLNALLLLFMDKDISIEVENVVDIFVRRKPRRLLLADSMSDWTHRSANLQINEICYMVCTLPWQCWKSKIQAQHESRNTDEWVYMVWSVLIFPWAVLRRSKNVSSDNPNKHVPRKL